MNGCGMGGCDGAEQSVTSAVVASGGGGCSVHSGLSGMVNIGSVATHNSDPAHCLHDHNKQLETTLNFV